MRARDIRVARFVVATLVILGAALALAHSAAASVHHVHLASSNATEAVKWYSRHLECEPLADRGDTVSCGAVEIVFVVRPTLGGSPGTGVDHIGFSFADLDAKMGELAGVGVRGSGVRLQRFEDGSTHREIPGLFKIGFIFDPWGTRIELVEDADTLGFHHVHLSSTDPQATLDWYAETLGGELQSLAERLPGVRFGKIWVLASPHAEGSPAPTEGRAIDHIGFAMADLGEATTRMKKDGVTVLADAERPALGRSKAKRAFLSGPDGVRIALVEPDWAGEDAVSAFSSASTPQVQEAYEPPRTAWGEPDLQGMWTGNAAHGIPLERPEDLADKDSLTPEEAAARRERGTLGSIWGYEREWRDTTLGYVKSAPSTQVAMIIDPPDGRLPEMTENGRAAAGVALGRRDYRQVADGPEDLTPYVRCISRGLPGQMMPSIYNNGLQISQSPGHVAIQKEMIHETRIVPTEAREPLSDGLKQWLGDPQGHWDGDTLVVETRNFNGRAPYRLAGENMTLTERFTRVGPTVLEYEFTVEDLTVWTSPWTGRFYFDLDNEQYELVEYACHEGNYGMTNILSGARARDREAAAAAEAEGN